MKSPIRPLPTSILGVLVPALHTQTATVAPLTEEQQDAEIGRYALPPWWTVGGCPEGFDNCGPTPNSNHTSCTGGA